MPLQEISQKNSCFNVHDSNSLINDLNKSQLFINGWGKCSIYRSVDDGFGTTTASMDLRTLIERMIDVILREKACNLISVSDDMLRGYRYFQISQKFTELYENYQTRLQKASYITRICAVFLRIINNVRIVGLEFFSGPKVSLLSQIRSIFFDDYLLRALCQNDSGYSPLDELCLGKRRIILDKEEFSVKEDAKTIENFFKKGTCSTTRKAWEMFAKQYAKSESQIYPEVFAQRIHAILQDKTFNLLLSPLKKKEEPVLEGGLNSFSGYNVQPSASSSKTLDQSQWGNLALVELFKQKGY